VHEHLYSVIMAGGVGSRLWPRSRNRTPKQFLDLVSGRTLLQQTVDRIVPLIPLERLLVVTSADHAEAVRSQVPGLPGDNLILEPGPRNTAPCIGLAAKVLQRRDPDAIMSLFPADHSIANAEGLRQAIAAASRLAGNGYLVTLGITPSHPHVGYGYIQRGARLGDEDGLAAYRVRCFAEKPDPATAQEFVDSGEYYWNAGIFIWQAARILAEIARLLPQLDTELDRVAAVWGSSKQFQVLAEAWERVPRISIDYGVMEKAAHVAVLPVDIGWDDVGNWGALADLAEGDDQGNAVRGEGQHLLLDCSDSYVYTSSGRLVAAVGLEGWIVVDTPDALLICPKDRAQAVREIVERLKAGGLSKYL
jgi:mannose-1-phosphate guanylyltransferase